MAKKNKKIFECQVCGYQSSKWLGKCPNCGEWDSFVEIKEKSSIPSIEKDSKVIALDEVVEDEVERFSSGDDEFDLVLGGGIVPGSLILIGGSPGVGKSTLMLKMASSIDKKVLYIAGEESPGQIKLRAMRLKTHNKNLFLYPEIVLENIIAEIKSKKYEVVIIDSIQTLYSNSITSAPGSVSQVREATFELMRTAKELKIPIFIIGHLTKEGAIAGPRVLEHMVDVVLYFEGDASRELRILRGVKNRFGPTSEIGIFEMTQTGIIPSKNRLFFSKKAQVGSAVTVIMEGTRPIVIEVQALVADSYGPPRRSTTGYELNRLNMFLALLEKKLNLPFNQYDVFVNIAGGIKINETAGDLAVIASILSSFRNRPISKETIFIGEVSLVGDIREVPNLDMRLKEAKNLGFLKAIVPNKPLKEYLKTFVVTEVEKLVEWM